MTRKVYEVRLTAEFARRIHVLPELGPEFSQEYKNEQEAAAVWVASFKHREHAEEFVYRWSSVLPSPVVELVETSTTE